MRKRARVGENLKRKRTSDEQKIEQNSHYAEMETNKPPNNARAAFKRDVRKEYGVKQCLTKWGVDMKGVIAGGNDKRTVSIVQEQSTRNR